jgi:hypothetical protein
VVICDTRWPSKAYLWGTMNLHKLKRLISECVNEVVSEFNYNGSFGPIELAKNALQKAQLNKVIAIDILKSKAGVPSRDRQNYEKAVEYLEKASDNDIKSMFTVVRESGDEEQPLYVEYHSERQGEEPFMMHGQKFQYCNGKYPNGSVDVAVYSFAGDMCYSYDAFRQMHNLKEVNSDTTRGGKSIIAVGAPGSQKRQMAIADPTKEEMMEFLRQRYGREEGFEYDAEEAIYWFANWNHGGQSSNLYSVLSTSQFTPGRISNGPEKGSAAEMMEQDLESEFSKGAVGEASQVEPYDAESDTFAPGPRDRMEEPSFDKSISDDKFVLRRNIDGKYYADSGYVDDIAKAKPLRKAVFDIIRKNHPEAMKTHMMVPLRKKASSSDSDEWHMGRDNDKAMKQAGSRFR